MRCVSVVMACVLLSGCVFEQDTGDGSSELFVVPAVSLLPNIPHIEQTILDNSSGFGCWIPCDVDVAMVAEKGLYFSLGTDKEAELVRLAKIRNPELKTVVLTNGCTIVGSADYHWLDARNGNMIDDCAYEWMANNGYPRRHRLCGIGYPGPFADSEFELVTTHYSVLYSSMFTGVKCRVVADVTTLDLEHLPRTTFLICPERDRQVVEEALKGRKVRCGFVAVEDSMQVEVVKMFVKFVREKRDEDEELEFLEMIKKDREQGECK